jgi:hypothetical protein
MFHLQKNIGLREEYDQYMLDNVAMLGKRQMIKHPGNVALLWEGTEICRRAR